jgi:hypothetical protein
LYSNFRSRRVFTLFSSTSLCSICITAILTFAPPRCRGCLPLSCVNSWKCVCEHTPGHPVETDHVQTLTRIGWCAGVNLRVQTNVFLGNMSQFRPSVFAIFFQLPTAKGCPPLKGFDGQLQPRGLFETVGQIPHSF